MCAGVTRPFRPGEHESVMCLARETTGVHDVYKHVATAKHKGSSKALSRHENLSVFFQKILMIKLQELEYCWLIL